ncbi:MAG: DUF4296 domain-containing protein [Raineya sp.]|jgi:hypothetical protein|nr:DUF4296 domain-containing protein [Raineya sp.]
MKKYLFVIITLLVIISCQKEIETPKNLLQSKKMVAILIDIHLLESQTPHLTRTPDSSYILYKAFEKKIFQKHQTDSLTYQQSYRYYLNNLQEFEKIYAQVIDSLVYRESTLNLGKPILIEKVKDTTISIKKDSLRIIQRKKIKEMVKKENLKLNS